MDQWRSPRRTFLQTSGVLMAGISGCGGISFTEEDGSTAADAGTTDRTETDESGATNDADESGTADEADELLARYRFEGDLSDETGRYDLTGENVNYTDDSPEGSGGATWDGAYAQTEFRDLAADDPVTVCFWLRDSETRTTWDDDLIWKLESDGDDVGSFCTRGGEVLLFTSGDNSIGNTEADALDGEWHHVAFVLDPAERRLALYLDGSEEYDVEYTDSIEDASETTLKVGNLSRNSHKQYDGDLDDLRFYDRALSSAEVESVRDGERLG